MSLTDLKKTTKAKEKKREFTVDEFIADAENYALGHPEILNNDNTQNVSIEQAIIAAKQQLASKNTKREKPFRHATFTLSEQAIHQLQNLAKETKLAKSHIIRILINELCNEEQHNKLKKLLDSGIN
ncbi:MULTISPECIES: hypothetical protein [unclassified Colwellia]|uniref:hypothetical protein n=1 Tax=unclassified Colwellia TaxID=196834 RepID=UPI0015F5FC61|nr:MULTISPECIES: hypothetical protein [unclassified Colwellia]MBA6231174.1 hypothetical protein [Colwellia sp. MB02u-7]MBA6235057.1 hypothetical protein [Colwellia sp. MB02u-11]MBA6257559.1 hypothetical protein [Colwellia sp. MB3u-28]MBA6260631.1 hypothetical protein [Colwellia sp. MB3u-41]MBA6301734.1 hypothetical protein [Colwellia sp. MB3u-22]